MNYPVPILDEIFLTKRIHHPAGLPIAYHRTNAFHWRKFTA